MKRGLVVFLLVGILFWLWPKPTQAQVGQNVVLSCLDATRPNEGGGVTISGQNYTHVVNLKNRDQNVFSPNQPVYVVRSLPKVFCNPNSNDPACTKQPGGQICIQEKVGANVCNKDCPAHNIVCGQHKEGGNTICCMDNYTKQGPYFECAKDRNGEVVCPGAILADEGQNNGIHVAENGHVETGYNSILKVLTADKSGLLADGDGNINIEWTQSYTRANLEHSFYGMQILSDSAIIGEEAFTNGLKLAVFAELEEIEPSATNCTTVFWDPYGRVIDSLRLEPIMGVAVELKNMSSFGQKIKTTVPNNPTFSNPDLTDEAGEFNFAVPPGIYFLTPSHSLFTYPLDQSILSGTLGRLGVFDPGQEYIKRDKIYNNSDEQIVEQAGQSERRDLILQPKDADYQGSTPVVLFAENLRDGTSQLVRGRVSHPKSIVRAVVNNNVVGQTEAALDGSFRISIAQESLNVTGGNFQIVAEKVPLVSANNQESGRIKDLFSWLVGKVLAQASSVSRPYSLSLVPTRLVGLVFDPSLKVKPNAIVEVTLPSMGGVVFAQTSSDSDGFVNIQNTNLPPFDFALRIRDKDKPQNSYQLTIEDFAKTNSAFFTKTNGNLYNNNIALNKPDPSTLMEIANETQRKVPPSTLSFNQRSRTTNFSGEAPTPADQYNPDTNGDNQGSGILLAILAVVAIIGVLGFLLIKRGQSKNQMYY